MLTEKELEEIEKEFNPDSGVGRVVKKLLHDLAVYKRALEMSCDNISGCSCDRCPCLEICEQSCTDAFLQQAEQEVGK